MTELRIDNALLTRRARSYLDSIEMAPSRVQTVQAKIAHLASVMKLYYDEEELVVLQRFNKTVPFKSVILSSVGLTVEKFIPTEVAEEPVIALYDLFSARPAAKDALSPILLALSELLTRMQTESRGMLIAFFVGRRPDEIKINTLNVRDLFPELRLTDRDVHTMALPSARRQTEFRL